MVNENMMLVNVIYFQSGTELNFDIHGGVPERIELYDCIGRLQLNAPVNNNKIVLSSANLESGIYLALLSFKSNTIKLKCYIQKI